MAAPEAAAVAAPLKVELEESTPFKLFVGQVSFRHHPSLPAVAHVNGRLALLSSLTRLVQGCRRQGRGGPRLVAESAPARAAVAPEKLPLCPYLPLSACAEAQYPILKRARLPGCGLPS